MDMDQQGTRLVRLREAQDMTLPDPSIAFIYFPHVQEKHHGWNGPSAVSASRLSCHEVGEGKMGVKICHIYN